MKPAECPYNAIDKLLPKVCTQAEIIFVDFHAEATSEKIAMGYHLDGRVSCIFGTHTHVPTADEKILPKGTAYITDIGMTGAHDSVIGRGVESVLKSFRTRMPVPFEVATGDVKMNGILVTVDSNTRKAEHIERIRIDAETADTTRYDTDDGKPEYYNNFE
jgi:metallophosphoesterase (TIGR00282 family)